MAELATTSLFSDGNLLAYWKLENTSASIGGFTLTNVNTTTFAAAKYNNGSNHVIASSQYLYNSDTSLDLTGNFTYVAWFNVNSLGSTNTRRDIVSERSVANTIGQSLIGILGNTDAKGTSSAIYAETWDVGGGFLTLDSGVVPTIGVWYHVAFVKAAANDWALYVNGVSKATSNSSRTISATTKAGFDIGALDQGTGGIVDKFDGLIDDVAIFSRNLSGAEILTLYTDTAATIATKQLLMGTGK